MDFRAFLHKAPLGKETHYEDLYNKELLCPIPRSLSRMGRDVSFVGYDIWRAYELSWLNKKGRPEVAVAHFIIPCHSPYLIESKSFKLYLQSFSQSCFESQSLVLQTLKDDLSEAVGLPVTVLFNASTGLMEGKSLDTLDCTCDTYDVDPSFLKTSDQVVYESWKTDLFKAHCLVTGQPDFASIGIRYEGPQIDPVGLLQYLVSYRKHRGLHEQCIEQIYGDIKHHCRPAKLMVTGCFTRRGGLDINPCRSSHEVPIENMRLPRQ